ncbi:UNVERIFIED_CONTAM: hypothetical protein FKN15_027657 [Acipenser sinensis]
MGRRERRQATGWLLPQAEVRAQAATSGQPEGVQQETKRPPVPDGAVTWESGPATKDPDMQPGCLGAQVENTNSQAPGYGTGVVVGAVVEVVSLPSPLHGRQLPLCSFGHSIPCCNEKLAATPGEAELAATPGEAELAASPDKAELAATPDEAELAATPGEAELAATPGEAELAATPGEAELAATPGEAELAATPGDGDSGP